MVTSAASFFFCLLLASSVQSGKRKMLSARSTLPQGQLNRVSAVVCLKPANHCNNVTAEIKAVGSIHVSISIYAPYSYLLFADDSKILSDPPPYTMSVFSKKYGLSPNVCKTKVVCFGPLGKSASFHGA